MKHEDAIEAAKAELKPLERLLAQPAKAMQFERTVNSEQGQEDDAT